MAKTETEFLAAIPGLMREAQAISQEFVDINAGQVHRLVGDYPGPDHRMPICCRVMRGEMRAGDTVLSEPPKKQGASLTMRYRLPRR
jgi:5-methylcytosine-specific restriction protein A